ncbi:hypothetical protein N7476_005022 [Penicillium atrosanguineum]|uniref:Uncharacterized protein n=1 Tax=Penicillium atrosanguineum TaxID=1132637 RepID=A0A9W9PZ42_9EURO|nr:hypothetical protein N7476_005022 [Penicillium atrosanguineum]
MLLQLFAAAGFLVIPSASAQSVIHSGKGFGTYYYDIEQVDACGTNFEDPNSGGVMCSSATLLSLDQMNTNYVVAMNNTQLGENPSLYCGKKVIVSINGQRSDMALFIGDGCQRCGVGSSLSTIWNAEGAPGLDFSYTVLSKLSEGSACSDGHVAVSWEILDESIYDFDDSSSGSLSASGSTDFDAAAVQPLAQSVAPTMTVASDGWLDVSPTTCSDNVWRCSGDVLEQCIGSAWSPRVTCASGSSCQGGYNPYCT